MNIEQLRQALKNEWMNYYCNNREWLVRLGVWVNCEGTRRPSSSFILATLTALEPQLTRLMPLMVDLNSSPDRIVATLGLNFNPDELADEWGKNHPTTDIKLLTSAKTGELKLGQRQYSVGSAVHLEEAVTVPSDPSAHRSVHRSNVSVNSSTMGGGVNTRSRMARGRQPQTTPYRKEETNDIIGAAVKTTTVRSTTISTGRGDRVSPRPRNGDRHSSSAARSPSSDVASSVQSFSVPSGSTSSSSSSNPITPFFPIQPTHHPGQTSPKIQSPKIQSPKIQDEQCVGRQWNGTDEIWR